MTTVYNKTKNSRWLRCLLKICSSYQHYRAVSSESITGSVLQRGRAPQFKGHACPRAGEGLLASNLAWILRQNPAKKIGEPQAVCWRPYRQLARTPFAPVLLHNIFNSSKNVVSAAVELRASWSALHKIKLEMENDSRSGELYRWVYTAELYQDGPLYPAEGLIVRRLPVQVYCNIRCAQQTLVDVGPTHDLTIFLSNVPGIFKQDMRHLSCIGYIILAHIASHGHGHLCG